MSSRRAKSLVIGSGFPLTQFAILLFTPLLPVLGHAFGVSAERILLTPTVVLFGYLIGHLFWGTLSDYWNRRHTLLLGLLLFIVSALLTSFSGNLTLFWVFSCILGFSAATFTSVGNAFMVDIYGKEKAVGAIAYIGIAMATTPIVVPPLSTALYQAFGWSAIYQFMALYGIVMLVGFLMFVRPRPGESQAPAAHDLHLLKRYASHLSNGKFMKNVASLALKFGVFVTSISMLPYIYVHYLAVTRVDFSILGFVVLLPSLIMAIVAKTLVKAYGTKRLINVAAVLTLIGSVGLVILFFLDVKLILLVTLALMFIFSGVGLSLPMCKGASMTSVSHSFGAASSLMKCLQTLGPVVVTGINADVHQAFGLFGFAVLLLIVSVISIAVRLA